MKESFENRGNQNILVYELQPEDRLEGQSLRALANKKIEGVAPAAFSQVDTTKFIRYDVSGKITMNQLLATCFLSKKQVLGVFEGMLLAMTSIDRNQIDPTTVPMDPEHVFVNPETGETVMICLPVIRPVHPGNTLSALCKFFMQFARLDRSEDTSYTDVINAYLNANPVVSLSELKVVLERAEAAAPAPQSAPEAPAPQSAPAPAAPVSGRMPQGAYVPQNMPPVAQPAPVPQSVPVPQPMPQPNPANVGDGSKLSMFQLMQNNKANNGHGGFAPAPAPQGFRPAPVPAPQSAPAPMPQSAPAPVPQSVPAPAPQSGMYGRPVAAPPAAVCDETMVLGSDPNATTVLDSSMLNNPTPPAYLIRVKNGEKIILNKPVFRIGKERSYVDYFVCDNSAVSRAHANIISKDGEYFIVDTNSTNHTYINGGMIPSGMEIRLPHEAQLRLANEDFVFYRY